MDFNRNRAYLRHFARAVAMDTDRKVLQIISKTLWLVMASGAGKAKQSFKKFSKKILYEIAHLRCVHTQL